MLRRNLLIGYLLFYTVLSKFQTEEGVAIGNCFLQSRQAEERNFLRHLALVNHDEALTALEKAAAERDPWLVWFGTEPKLDPLRDDPRFKKVFRSTNNPLAFR